MTGLLRALRRVRALLTSSARDRELNEELAFHIEMETAKNVERGFDAAQAHTLAVRKFGGVARYRDEARDARGVRALEDFVGDLRIGLRGLLRNRVYAAVAIITLGIGIGGTTAVFGAVYGVLLAPLPFTDADRVVSVWETNTRAGTPQEVSPANFLDWRTRARSFAHLGAAEPYSLDYIGPDGPERFQTSLVTEGYFDALGVHPVLGRTFLPEEFVQGRHHVVLLSEALWRRRFGGDSGLVGRTLVLDSIPRTVVGIVPRAFTFPYDEDAWQPKIFRPDEREDRQSAYWTVVGRLHDGTTLAAAQSEMRQIGAALGREHPTTNANTGAAVVSIRETLIGRVRSALLILFGAVGFVLLIACANVASLQLVQAVRRRRELAIRSAIGAGRTRLARQLFAENVLLALFGGGVGVALAHWGLVGIRAIAPDDLPRVAELRTSPVVLAFALVMTLASSLLFGLAPMLEAGRLKLSDALTSSGRAVSAARTTRRAHNALVVSEVALALVLLVGAGLLVRSFRALMGVDRGFDARGVLVATLQTWSYYPTPTLRVAYSRDATARLAAIPGVTAAGMTSSLPLAVSIGQERAGIRIEGQPPACAGETPTAHVTATTPGFFDVLRIPLREGRMLAAADGDGAARVAVVNETFARRFFPEGRALGQHVAFAFMGPPVMREIVGVVADIRHDGPAAEARPSVFVPHAHAPTGAMHLVVRTTGDRREMDRAIRTELTALNGVMPLSDMTTLDALLGGSLRERRFHLSLLGAFSVMALVLAAVGIYGLVSTATSARTHEIGVRVAIGARAADVSWMVLRQGAVLTIAGIALGVAGAIGLTRLLSGMLFHVTPLDVMTFGGASALLLLAAVLACWIPARRAAAVDPIAALRE